MRQFESSRHYPARVIHAVRGYQSRAETIFQMAQLCWRLIRATTNPFCISRKFHQKVWATVLRGVPNSHFHQNLFVAFKVIYFRAPAKLQKGLSELLNSSFNKYRFNKLQSAISCGCVRLSTHRFVCFFLRAYYPRKRRSSCHGLLRAALGNR